MPHRARPEHKERFPVHITLRVVRGIRNLRSKVPYRLIKHAMAQAKEREGFRLVHFTVQKDHLHFIVEAVDERVLSNAIRGLEIRIAHKISRLQRRKGRLFVDRYHRRDLTTPNDVRNTLNYVLLNSRHHAYERDVALPKNWIDPYSSCDRFGGWTRPVTRLDPIDDVIGSPVTAARTWLLNEGWKNKHGLLHLDHTPGPLHE